MPTRWRPSRNGIGPPLRGELQDELGVIVDIVVNRVAFGMPEAAATDEKFEVQEGLWSKDWIGLYCKAELPPPSRSRT